MPKDPEKLKRQIAARGWNETQVREAPAGGQSFPAINIETGGPATRYTHPVTGRSIVIDDTSGEVIHVGGDGFKY